MPFQIKRSQDENIRQIPGLDPESTNTLLDGMDMAEVQESVMNRMGTDSQREPEPPSTRDLISAAIDQHTQGE